MSKTTQRRAVVAALSFALGAAGTLPALAASTGGSADPAPAVPNAMDALGGTLYDLPFVSYLPGDELLEDDGEFVDDGGLVGGLPIVGGLVSNLPVVGGLAGGGAQTMPTGGVAGGLPVVGPLVSSLPVVGNGGLAEGGLPVVGGLPIVGGVVSSLPIIGNGGLLGGLLGGAGGLLGGGTFL